MRYVRSLFLFALIIACSSVYGQSSIEVYFTNPESKETVSSVQKALLHNISNSSASIYAALYEITDPLIIEALCSAKLRGIDVRLVLESDGLKDRVKSAFEASGIPIRLDDRRPFMHNKFFIFDGTSVWTGSYNITEREAKLNNNNALLIRCEIIAAIYSSEFSEMFDNAVFGNRSDDNIFPLPAHKYYSKIQDSNVNVYFAPDNNVERIIIKRIQKAKKSVFFMAFSFTSDEIGEAMIAKHKQGIIVKGIFEKRDIKNVHSEYIKLKVEGLDVLYDANPKTMHHKVIIIDDEWIITGSYNFSKNAKKRNDENCLVIQSQELAKLYIQEFNTLYRLAYTAKQKEKNKK